MRRALYWVVDSVPRFLVIFAVQLALLIVGMLATDPGWGQEGVKFGFMVTAMPLWAIFLGGHAHGDGLPSRQQSASPTSSGHVGNRHPDPVPWDELVTGVPVPTHERPDTRRTEPQ